MSYTFTPWHTGLVAHVGGLDGDGDFYTEARPCVGYVTNVDKVRDGHGGWEDQASTVLAVLDRERGYEVQSLHDVLVGSPDAVIVAVLPAGAAPTPAQLARAEEFSRRCAGRYPAPHMIERTAAA